jgi:hypothetical protein
VTLLSFVLFAAVAGTNPALPAEQYAPGEVLIKLTPECRPLVNRADCGRLTSFGIPELDNLSARWNVSRIVYLIHDPHPDDLARKYGMDLYYWLFTDKSTDVPAMVTAYQACPAVAWAGPDLMRPLYEVPNDPRYPNQWHLYRTGAQYAWDISHGDTNVRIGVVDDGVDYFHPDISNNIWINAAEDINHNGKFDPYPPPQGDLNDSDDDGNGYTDDVCGYDFRNQDPDPMPVGNDNHGTHCWGITNAVTNNDTGVASIAWGCRGMGLKAGEGGFVNMPAAIAAIYYCVEKGAWVSSHSYGSASPYQPERDAMQYAVDAGEIVVCAAGNDGVSSPHYPGAYEMVIGVSATGSDGRRTSWSNYGTWTDVCAPGAGIISTVPDSNYAAMDGTSMACPFVAGLVSLIKAANPGMSNTEVTDRLFATCDTMSDSLYRIGMLGHGRVNPMKALCLEYRCMLSVVGTHLNDPNGNGIPEPGEVCGLTVTLHNDSGWQSASSATATLVCNDPNITVIKSTATFPAIPSGGQANCAADSFVFQVNANAIPHRVCYLLSKTATPPDVGPGACGTFQVGLPSVLFVDDFAGDSVGRWYRWAADSLRLLYDRYSVAASGAPSAETLRHYPVVIWYTGLDSTRCLSPDCQTAISSYLDNNGKLFICGQSIGQNIGATPFYANYLKAEFDTASTGKFYILGLPGDTIGHGDTLVCAGAGGANNAKSCDGIRPTGGALGCAIYRDLPDTTIYAGLRYSGSYKLVYFSMPFEAIDHATGRYTQKWTILRRIFGFFEEPLPPVAVDEPPVVAPGLTERGLRIAPNPARNQVSLHYNLASPQPVSVRVYDAQGRVVAVPKTGIQPAGTQRVNWNLRDRNGRPVRNGIYFCTVQTGSETRSGKVLVAR